jgi:hypothetical protein
MVECAADHLGQFKLALQEALKYCEQESIANIVLVVSALQNVQGTVIASTLGADTAKGLAQGKTLTLTNPSRTVTVLPAAKVGHAARGSLLLGVHLASSDIGKLDDSLSAAAIVYCPWTEDDGVKWLKTWEPKVWGESTWQVAPLNLHPAVEVTLNDIHSRVNVSSSLLHYADREFATKAFKSLQKGRHSFDAEDVRIWALRNGWKQSGSDALFKVAKKYEN